jgi:hypothetical protein
MTPEFGNTEYLEELQLIFRNNSEKVTPDIQPVTRM